MSTNKFVQVIGPHLVFSQPNQFLIWTCTGSNWKLKLTEFLNGQSSWGDQKSEFYSTICESLVMTIVSAFSLHVRSQSASRITEISSWYLMFCTLLWCANYCDFPSNHSVVQLAVRHSFNFHMEWSRDIVFHYSSVAFTEFYVSITAWTILYSLILLTSSLNKKTFFHHATLWCSAPPRLPEAPLHGGHREATDGWVREGWCLQRAVLCEAEQTRIVRCKAFNQLLLVLRDCRTSARCHSKIAWPYAFWPGQISLRSWCGLS